ncbi:MAG TPA: tetratricopeptide repeat protein [Polyangia bacterium]|jgi:tetratricopeptide (TPR) repeat protein
MVEIPDSLVDRLKARQVVLVAGLGCSELAGAPGWTALVESLADRPVFSDVRAQIAGLVNAGRLGDALALLRDLLAPAQLEEAIEQAFPDGAPLPESVKQAADFPWRAVVTTAFDDQWARALGAAPGRKDPLRVLVGIDASARARFGGPDTPLIHLCGRRALPKSLCIGAADARKRLLPSAGMAWLDQLQRRRSLVLVGFRPEDPDLAWLAAWLAAQPVAQPAAVPHYLFLDLSEERDPDREAQVWELRTGLTVLPCVEGTAEALTRIAKIATSIGAQLPRSDGEVDLAALLERWARNPADPEPRQVLARAEAALRDEERWDRLVELLLRRLDLQEDPREQIAALGEVARLFRDKLDAPERALKAEVVMLRLLPGDDDLWERLRADARAGGAWGPLCAEARWVAEMAGATPAATRIWRELARVEREELGRPADALASLQQALLATPGHREARAEQIALLRALGRWPDLVAALKGAAAETDEPDQAIAGLLEAAEVLEGPANDPTGAGAAYEAVLAIAPDREPAVAALERLYTREKRWGDLAALLERRADHLPAAEATALHHRRVEILVDHLDALGQAAELLETLAATGDRSALTKLEEIYRRAERHDDYLATLARLADAAGSQAERIAALRRLAAEAEALPDGEERAIRALDEILRLDPRDGDAFAALERICRAERRFATLAEALARRLEVTETAEAKRDLLLALARLYETELGDPERALETYMAAKDAGDRREEIHEATARLAERLRRWPVCAEALLAWADSAGESELQAEVLVEAARVFIDHLNDGAAAEAALEQVAALAPEHPRALAILGRVREESGAVDQAVALYERAAATEPDRSEKSALLTRAAVVLLERGKDEDRAADLLVRALAADPGHRNANERLVDVYSRREQWDDVEALLDRELAEEATAPDADRLAALETQLARAAIALGKGDKALECLQSAHARRPELLPMLRTFADFRYGRDEWQEGVAHYESLLRLHRAALPAEELPDIFQRIGRAKAELGDADGAIAAYREVRALAPEQRPALEGLSALLAAKGDWAGWVAEQEALAAVATDGKGAIWEAIGDACAEHLGDRARAEAAYRQALAAEPARRSAIEKLLATFREDQRAEQTVEMLAALAAVELSAGTRAQLRREAARLLLDKVNRPLEAAELLERSLDDAPEAIEAFDELCRLREDAMDWPGLVQSHKAMLERLPPDAPRALRLRLWTRMGNVALRQLRDRKLAMTAFEAAVTLDPDDRAKQETLAHVYEVAGPDARPRAIAAHQRLIAHDPHRTDSFLALAKLYGETGETDKRWCVAATLWYLKKNTPALDELFHRHRSPRVRSAQRRFTEETWTRVRHPDEDQRIGEMFAVASPYLASSAAYDPADVGLKKRAQVELEHDTSLWARTLVELGGTLLLPLPDVYRMEGESGQTTLVNVRHRNGPRPTLLLGPPTMRRNSFDLVFDLAPHFSFLRPERFPRVALRTPAILQGVLGVLRSFGAPNGGGAPLEGEAGQLRAHLARSMPPAALARLAEATRRLDGDGETLDIEKWIGATDLSAARLALALTGELAAAFRVISSEAIPQSTVPIHRRMADLVAFSVSDDYFALRRELGLAVG